MELKKAWKALAVFLVEIILVDSFDFVSRRFSNANFEIDHQIPKHFAIDEHEFAVDARGIVNRFAGKIGRGDKDALFGPESLERPREFLNLGPTHSLVPALGLKVDYVESEAILLDDPIDALVSGLANGLSGILSRSAIAHRNDKLDDRFFKKGRG